MAKRTPAARDTRERILDTALAEFGAKGYAAASIDEIAARAGVTKGAVYYWFEDKADVARDLQRDIWERLKAAALTQIDPAGDTIENLLHGFDAYLEALQDMDLARFFLRDTWELGAADASSTEDRDDAVAFVRAFLEEGMRRREIVALDPTALAYALVGMFNEVTLHVLDTGQPGPTREVVARLLTSLAPSKARSTAKARR